MLAVMEFIYEGDLDLAAHSEDVMELMYACERLAFGELRNRCESYIANNLDAELAPSVLAATDLWIDSPLRQYCITYILHHIQEVRESEYFNAIDKNVWIHLFAPAQRV